MNMNKKIFSIIIFLISFCIFNKDVDAIVSRTTWNSSTEELIYDYEANLSGIRRIWLECTGSESVTITLYVHSNGFTKEPVMGAKDTNNIKNGTYTCKAYVATEGDNKDRESDGDITFTKKNYDSSKNTSGYEMKESCSYYTTEEACIYDSACVWNSGSNTCNNNHVAERACDEPDIRKVLRFFGYLLLIARVAIPLIIIGFATFDLFKSVIDKDEKSFGKQVKMVIIRISAGVLVFFIPNLVNAVFGLSDALNVIDGEQYQSCATCLLKPGDCEVED